MIKNKFILDMIQVLLQRLTHNRCLHILNEEEGNQSGNSKLFRVMNKDHDIEKPWCHNQKCTQKKMYIFKYICYKSQKSYWSETNTKL